MHCGLAGYGANVHNAPGTLGAHSGKDHLAKTRKAEKIHLNLPAGVFHRDRLNGAEVSVPGIVHKNIQVSNHLQAGFQGFFGGDIQCYGCNAKLLQRLHQGHAAGGGKHGVPHAGKLRGGVIANSAAGSGNKDPERFRSIFSHFCKVPKR